MVLKPCVLISWECLSAPGQLSLPFIANTFAARYHLKCFPVELVAVCMYLKLILLSVLAQNTDVQHDEVLALRLLVDVSQSSTCTALLVQHS